MDRAPPGVRGGRVNSPPRRRRWPSYGVHAGVLGGVVLGGVVVVVVLGAMAIGPRSGGGAGGWQFLAAGWQYIVNLAAPRTRQGGIEHGVYFGWASSRGGTMRLGGAVCSPDDPVVAVVIPGRNAPWTLGATEVFTEHADVGLPERVATLTLAADSSRLTRFEEAAAEATTIPRSAAERATLPSSRDMTFHHLVARCRSGAETRVGVGSARWLLLPREAADGPDLGVRIVASRSAPHLGVLAAMVVTNEGREPVTLSRVTYAPTAAATGRVRAAAGTAEQFAGWRQLVTGHGAGPGAGLDSSAVDPNELTPWHAAYQSPDDPRAMRERPSDDLRLRLEPGEVAMIVIDQDSLVTTRGKRRVILYPVLTITRGELAQRNAYLLGSPLPAVGWTPPRVGWTSPRMRARLDAP